LTESADHFADEEEKRKKSDPNAHNIRCPVNNQMVGMLHPENYRWRLQPSTKEFRKTRHAGEEESKTVSVRSKNRVTQRWPAKSKVTKACTSKRIKVNQRSDYEVLLYRVVAYETCAYGGKN
jgi:hypothetical protein